MKKVICALLLLALTAAMFTACGAKAPASAAGKIEGTPEEIIEKIYAAHKDVDLALVSMEVDISDADAVQYYTGLENGTTLDSAAVSETMLGQPYSLVVVKARSEADAAAAAKTMYQNIDMRKWICVAADQKTAAWCGDVAIFFMVSDDFADLASAQSILEAFRTACGGEINTVS